MKVKSDDWLRNGLLDASIASPFLPPFLPCTTTLPQKWRQGNSRTTQGYSDASVIQTLKAETPRNHSIASAYIRSYNSVPTELTQAYLGYGYGRTTTMVTGILRLRLWAYYDYVYGSTTTEATGVLQLRLRANVRAYYVIFLLRIPYLCKLVWIIAWHHGSLTLSFKLWRAL